MRVFWRDGDSFPIWGERRWFVKDTIEAADKERGDDLAAGLSSRLGDLLLTDKEAAGLVVGRASSLNIPRPR
jgi:hypothetical protein